MTLSSRGHRLFDVFWFVAWAVASSAWCLSAANELGTTCDEPNYVHTGLDAWRTGSHHELMKLGTMPLPVDVITLPLYIRETWQHRPADSDAEIASSLPVARAGTLCFWWLLLIYMRIAAGRLGGPWAGRLAVAWLACEPNFLAHASLATTDIAVTACLLAFVYHFATGRGRNAFHRLIVPALWFGLAVLAKASGLVFGCLCMLAVELEYLARAGALQLPTGVRDLRALGFWLARSRPFLRDARWIVGGGLVVVFLYCGSDWEPQRSFCEWADRLPDSALGRGLSWTAHHLTIFSNAGEGLVRQVGHNVRGHGVYLLGRTDRRAFWYYFPVIMAIKLALPVLLVPAFLLLTAPRTLTTWPCLAAGALLLFTPLCRVQIGIRFMLPLVALAVVGLAAGLVTAYRDSKPQWKRECSRILAGLAVGWTALAACQAWPNALCYANELWGPPSLTYTKVSDSNYDWGQGLKELAHWQQTHAMTDLCVWYFGTDPAMFTMPVHPVKPGPNLVSSADDPVGFARGHFLAVSTTYLYGLYATTPAADAAAMFLRRCTPVGRTRTFLIYDLRGSN